jgi:rubrerythrin
MMEIEIQEENAQKLLSKTQKQKIRRLVKDIWTDEMGFYDHIDNILEQVHYDPIHEHLKYNHIEHNLLNDKHLVLLFKTIHIETSEERRQKLRQKLKHAIQTKKRAVVHVDPHEQMYQRLCQQLPEEQRRIIPKPSHIKENLDMYKQMMTMLPNQNPLYQYLSSFMS